LTLAGEAPTVLRTLGNYTPINTAVHPRRYKSPDSTETVETGKRGKKIGYCIVKELFVKEPAVKLYLHCCNPV
jgi:hypothetical protein